MLCKSIIRCSNHDLSTFRTQENGSSDGVLAVVLLRVKYLMKGREGDKTRMNHITHLPPRSREYVFIPLVVTPLHDFPGVRFVLFLGSIGEQSDIVVNIEIEKGPRLAARFVDDKVVKCVVLQVDGQKEETDGHCILAWGMIRSSYAK